MVDTVDALRSFNRSFTQRIGVLDDSFLGSGRPLGQARLLFEIGPGDGTTTRELRQRLGLDSGYLSRLLRELEAEGSVVVATDPDDGRRRVVRLTPHGRTEWEELDRRSDELAGKLLQPLSDRQRVDLARALEQADRLLRAATVTFDEVDPTSPVARACMTAYFAELDRRFPHGFDPGDALAGGAQGMAAPLGTFVVARSDARAVACGGVVGLDAATGEIKRMWVDADWRGLGLGQRMLADLERRAAALGHTRVVLDTNGTLTEAIAMYARSGYTEIERYNDNPYAQHWFEKRLA
jgi:DNA-binding MarR family transcriptional regulator/GNAT superfamily N-acetyltransferase